MTDKDMHDAAQEEAANVTPAPASLSPGAHLAAGREEHGWTIDQVAAYLKLAPRQVLALERDDYPALPGMPIVRGFVRSYAKLLKIDATPLLAQLGGETVLVNEPLKPKESLSTPFSDARLPSMGEKPAISSRWVIGILILLLVIAAVWASQLGRGMFGFGTESEQSVPVAQPEITLEPADPVLEPLVPETEPVPVDSGSDAAPASPPASPEAAAPSATEQGPAVQPSTASAQTPAGPAANPTPSAPAAPVPGASESTLNLTVREESWIEIRRVAGGSTLVGRLVQAGETIAVEVGEPVVLVIGNAAGVDATFRGKPVELKGSTRTNVARVTLK